MNIWEELGIAPTRDAAEIRRAYAARVKQVNPEDDAEAFQRLRAAYEAAMNMAPRPGLRRSPLSAEPESGPALPFPADASYAAPAHYPPAKVTYQVPGLGIEWVFARERSVPAVRQAVASVINQLHSVPIEARPELLAEAMKRDGWQQLDFREQFQNDAAAALMAGFEQFIDLVPVFANEFNWAEHRSLGRQTLISELLARVAARRWRLRIEADVELRYAGKCDALEWLRKPVDEPAFQRVAADHASLRLVRDLMDEIRRNCPAALRYELNPKSVQWWTHQLASRSTAHRSAESTGSGNNFFLLFVVVMLLGRCLSEISPSAYRSPSASVTSYAPSSRSVPDFSLATRQSPAPVWSQAQNSSVWLWNEWEYYRPGDVVLYRGSWWKARQPRRGDVPGVSPQWLPGLRPATPSAADAPALAPSRH